MTEADNVYLWLVILVVSSFVVHGLLEWLKSLLIVRRHWRR
jgi:hypothetical protein